MTVTVNGEITIEWLQDDPQARLTFELTAPDTAFLDGFVLGWRGPDLPSEAPRSLTYRAVAPPETRKQALRTLIVELDPNADTYSYRLHVGYPDGSTHSVDPKIYNQGDGVPQPRG
ncbi:MAG: hypothetical protein ACLF0P_18005 [Thermoanaerobaculia bacterium]